MTRTHIHKTQVRTEEPEEALGRLLGEAEMGGVEAEGKKGLGGHGQSHHLSDV